MSPVHLACRRTTCVNLANTRFLFTVVWMLKNDIFSFIDLYSFLLLIIPHIAVLISVFRQQRCNKTEINTIFCLFVCFWVMAFCIKPLAVMELTLWTMLSLNSLRYTCLFKVLGLKASITTAQLNIYLFCNKNFSVMILKVKNIYYWK